MARMQPSKILEELLKEANENKEPDYQKIRELMEKSLEMQKEQRERSEKTEHYFNALRDQINESSSYLEKLKKELDNINFAYQQDKLKNSDLDYDEFMGKTDEEINMEMDSIQEQLAALEGRVKKLKESDPNDQINESIRALQNIAKDVSNDYVNKI